MILGFILGLLLVTHLRRSLCNFCSATDISHWQKNGRRVCYQNLQSEAVRGTTKSGDKKRLVGRQGSKDCAGDKKTVIPLREIWALL